MPVWLTIHSAVPLITNICQMNELINVAVLDLRCSTQDLQSSLQHAGSLVTEFELSAETCELLVVACGNLVP